jgi:hypothetical protein
MKAAAAIAVASVTAMMLNERMVRARSEAEGASLLKYASFRAEIANFLFRADMLKGVLGWSKVKNSDDVIQDLRKFTALQGEIMSMLNIDITEPDEMVLKRKIDELLFLKESNVSAAKHRKDQPALKALFEKVESWSETPVATPTYKSREVTLDLRDLFLSIVVSDVEAENIKSVDKFADDAAAKQQIIKKLEELKKTYTPQQASTPGDNAHENIDKAIQHVQSDGFNRLEYVNYDEKFKPGTQIAYEFSGGALHHAVYVGSNMVVEVQNYDTGKSVEGFVVINHLHNFLIRTAGNVSNVYSHVYENPLPPDMVARRALWTVGKFPNYHLSKENCESVAAWVVSNNFESSMCVIRPKPRAPQLLGGKRIRTYRKRRRTVPV